MRLSSMEGEATRKRKITNVEYDIVFEEEEEDDDVKMEKFFALIRSAKDIRDQLLDADEGSQARATKAAATEKKAEAVGVAKTTTSKKADVAVRASRKDKGGSSDAQNNGVSKSRVLIDNQPSATATATAAGGGVGGSGGARISRGSSEEDKGKRSAEYTNNNNTTTNNNYQQGGRMMLDLNLSL